MPLNTGPHAMALAQAHDRLFVSQYGRSCLSVIRCATGLAEHERAGARRPETGPTLVRHVLPLAGAVPACLFDAAGRRAATLRPGVNDIRNLRAGVYYIRTATGRGARQVVVYR